MNLKDLRMEKDNKMVPCKECLVLAVCRNKTYRRLVEGCSVLDEMLYDRNPGNRRKDFKRTIEEVDRLMGTYHQGALTTGEF